MSRTFAQVNLHGEKINAGAHAPPARKLCAAKAFANSAAARAQSDEQKNHPRRATGCSRSNKGLRPPTLVSAPRTTRRLGVHASVFAYIDPGVHTAGWVCAQNSLATSNVN